MQWVKVTAIKPEFEPYNLHVEERTDSQFPQVILSPKLHHGTCVHACTYKEMILFSISSNWRKEKFLDNSTCF